MDRQPTNSNISELLVSLLNSDSRVADSVRRALSTMGNCDDDTLRMMHLLQQLPSLLTPHHFVEQYMDDASRSSAASRTRMSQSAATLGSSSRSDTRGFGPHNRFHPQSWRGGGGGGHQGACLDEVSAALSLPSSIEPRISQDNLIARVFNAQSLEHFLVPAIINQILGQEQQSHHPQDQRYPISDHLHHFRASGGGSSREDRHQHPTSLPIFSFPSSLQSNDVQSSLKTEDHERGVSQQQQQLLQHIIDTARGSHVSSTAGSLSFPALGAMPHSQDMIAQAISAHIQMSTSSGYGQTTNNNHVSDQHFTQDCEPPGSLFPFILHDLLRDLERANQTSIASWTAQGDAFQIHREDIFSDKLLRMYFHIETMDQFCSLLQAWGFKAYTVQHGVGTLYKHPGFHRNSPGLRSLLQMKQAIPSRETFLPRKRGLDDGIPVCVTESATPEAQDDRKPISSPSSNPNRGDTLVDTIVGICGSPISKKSNALSCRGSPLSESKKKPTETLGKRRRISKLPDENANHDGSDGFLTRLRALLDKADHSEEWKKITGWTPDGLAFAIHDRQAFVANLLPQLMEPTSQFETFQHVLRAWGFQSVQEGVHAHPWFRKDIPSLVANLTPSEMRAVLLDQQCPATLPSKTAPSVTKVAPVGKHRKEPPREVEKTALTNNHESDRARLLDQLRLQDAAISSREANCQAPDQQLNDDSTRDKLSSMTPSSSLNLDAKNESVASNSIQSLGTFRINTTHDSYDVSGLMFPWHLHQMLDDAEHDDERRAGWNPDGASFFVQNHEMVVSTIIPKYFKRNMSWNEFTSELSNWGFVCFTAGPQKGSFIHRLQCKGRPSLCKQMRYKGKTVADILKNKAAFLLRLHAALAIMNDDGTSSACWSADGMSFCVTNPQHFLQDTFAAFYESMSLATFEQKLRSWGFVKETSNAKLGASMADAQHEQYSHPYFTRDQQPMIRRIASDIKTESIALEHGFLVRLRIMLDDVEKYGHQTIVSWLPHGKSFMIHDRPFFCDHILPHYFKTKLTSFRQTLRSYGFAQMGGHGWDSGSYYHKLFVRDDPSLCEGLSQEVMKQAMPEWIHPQDEPNFYAESTFRTCRRDEDGSGS